VLHKVGIFAAARDIFVMRTRILSINRLFSVIFSTWVGYYFNLPNDVVVAYKCICKQHLQVN